MGAVGMTLQRYLAGTRPTDHFVGRCAACVRPVRGQRDITGDRATLACPGCGGQVKGERIYGTVTRMACAPACEGASGPSCDCACGGINHGGVWSETGEAPASALEAYREREARREAERVTRREAERKRARAEFDAWAAGHRDLVAYLQGDQDLGGFMAGMRWHVRRAEILTDRQAQVAERIMREDAERAARRAAEAANAKPVPVGKGITVTGEVVSTRMDDSPYAYGKVDYKMLVKGDGWKVWATIPAALHGTTTTGNLFGLRGQRVTFTADVAASRDDPCFGIAKRPRAARILETASV